MSNTDLRRPIEFYLSDLDDYLLAYGLDPKKRLEHVEQTADALLTSGADPLDEFGPAADYAEELTSELGVPRRSPWLRILGLAFGHLLLQEGMVIGLIAATSVLAEDSEDWAYFWSPAGIVPPFFLGIAAWAMFSRTGIRWLTVTTNRWPTLAKVAATPLAVLAILVLSMGLVGRGTIELPLNWAVAALGLLAAAAGAIAIAKSGFWQLVWGALTSRTRPGSNMSYHPLGTPKVRIREATTSTPFSSANSVEDMA